MPGVKRIVNSKGFGSLGFDQVAPKAIFDTSSPLWLINTN